MREWQGKGASVSLCLIGRKAHGVLPAPGHADPRRASRDLGDRPHIKDLIGTVKVMLDAYREGKIDRLFLVQRAVRQHHDAASRASLQLLPVERGRQPTELPEHWDYIYEPDAAAILDGLLMRYIESQVYQGAVENVACEMAARMVAMKSASDNAGKLIERAAAGLQQGAAGGDHEGTGGDRRRRGGGLEERFEA